MHLAPSSQNIAEQTLYNAAMDLTLNELEQAINYWRRMRPSTGEERALSAEVNSLAGVYALMIFQRAQGLNLASLEPDALLLIQAWREAAQGHVA
jgi:hypothetical protein